MILHHLAARLHPVLRHFVVVPLLLAASAAAAEKTFVQYRFTPTRLRDNNTSNSVQVADFRLKLRGTPVDMTKATVTNPGGNSPGGEQPGNLLDGNPDTKWLDFNKNAVVFRFPAAVTIDAYGFTTAADAQERDPGNWRLEGSNDGASWTLLDEIVNGSVPTDRKAATPDFLLNATVQPYVSFWHPDYLLKWTPSGDSASDFNRSSVPIATRFSNAALNVNSNARPNEGKVTVLTTFGATSYQPSQGSAVEHFNAYTGWQYTDKLVYWGGSAGEAVIVPPGAPVTDAGHRNGVPVLGTIFFPPNVYGGQLQWVQSFLQKNGSTFPVADKLIEVCRYYGFDGWFINQETNGTNSTDAGNMRDFISYFRNKAPELQIMWYDAMNEGGGVGWQNEFNSSDDMFMSYNGSAVAHSMFLNFWWSVNQLTNSRTLAQNLGLNPYSIYAGIDVESAGSGTSANWDAIFPSGQAHRLSVAFYGAQSMFRNTGNPADFQKSEIRFWSGANGDPSNTATSDSWKGLANYIPASSPLNKLPFVTNFNRGQGNRYAVEGTTISTGGWNNLSLQDVLPTWKWLITSTTATKLVPSLELDDAYSGGTSLKISGTLDGVNDLKLYETSLPVSAETKFRLISKLGSGNGTTSMFLALTFEDAPQQPVYLSLGSATVNSWRSRDFDLSAHAGRRISTIGLRFSGQGISNYLMRIGRFAVFDGSVATPEPPSNLRVTQQDSVDADSLALRLKWDASTTPGIAYYQVIQTLPDGSRKWLGSTPGTVLYVPAARRKASESAISFSVQAIGADSGLSSAVSASATLPAGPDTSSRVTGTWVGTAGSYGNSGFTGDKVFDGNTSTYFDAPDDAAWTGLDFRAGQEKRLTAFRFFPRTGWSSRMVGASFQVANQADFSDAITIYTVTSAPVEGVYTTIPVTRTERFRFFRYTSSTGHGNVSEIQVYGYEPAGATNGLAASLDASGASLNWLPAAWAATYRVERASSASGPFTSLGDYNVLSFLDTTVPAGQKPYYRVSAVNPLGVGQASLVVQALPASPFLAWQLDRFGSETSAEIIAPEADPDHDGIPNLLEYAFGSNPLAAGTVVLEPAYDGSRISISYPQNAAATDITLKAQWSDDLVTWTDADVTYETVSSAGGTQQMRASAPAGAGQRFIRLVATGQ